MECRRAKHLGASEFPADTDANCRSVATEPVGLGYEAL